MNWWQKNRNARVQRKIGSSGILGKLLGQNQRDRFLVEGTKQAGLPKFRDQSEAQDFLSRYEQAGGETTELVPSSWQDLKAVTGLGGNQIRNLMQNGSPTTIANIRQTTANMGGATIIDKPTKTSYLVIQQMMKYNPSEIETMFLNSKEPKGLTTFLREVAQQFRSCEVADWDDQAFDYHTAAFQLIAKYLLPDQLGNRLDSQTFFVSGFPLAKRQAVQSVQHFLNPETKTRILEMKKYNQIL